MAGESPMCVGEPCQVPAVGVLGADVAFDGLGVGGAGGAGIVIGGTANELAPPPPNP